MTLVNVSNISGLLYGVLELTDEIPNKSILLLEMITLSANIYFTYNIILNKIRIYNPLIDDDTTELENHLSNMCNSSINEHTLYIIKESYYDNENRTLEDYKNYLKNLKNRESMNIANIRYLTMHNKYLVLGIIKLYPQHLQLFKYNKEFIDDKVIVLTAVKKYGAALHVASENLISDKDVVLAAVTNNGNALRYASNKMINTKEVVLAAVTNYGSALQFASNKMRNTKEVVLAAVENNSNALQFASNEMMTKDKIIEAFKNNSNIYNKDVYGNI